MDLDTWVSLAALLGGLLSLAAFMRVSLHQLEGRIDHRIDQLEGRIDSRIDQLDVKIDQVEYRLDTRIGHVEDRLEKVRVDVRADTVALTARIDGIYQILSHPQVREA